MKIIATFLSCMAAASSLTLFSLPVQASSVSFTPRASISLAQYKFAQSARPGALAPTGIHGNDFPEVTFNVTFKILGVGGTFFKDGYYLDLLWQKSGNEQDSFTLQDPLLPQPFVETFSGDRHDFSVTLGKKVLDNRGSVYIGYKTGKSEASGNQGQSLLFEEKGIFVGANYAWKVSDSSLLSLNLAYASLSGDLTEKVTNPAFASPAVLTHPLDINASSDAQGVSYGVSWSSRLTDTVSFSLALDSKNYTFNNIKDRNPAVITSDKFEEKFLTTTLSLYFLF